MSEQDIADIIATTDGDTTWGDDMRGAIATLATGRHRQMCFMDEVFWGVDNVLMPALTVPTPSGGPEGLSNLPSYNVYYPFRLPWDYEGDGFAIDVYTTHASSRKYTIMNADSGIAGFPGTAVTNATATISCAATGFTVTATTGVFTLTSGTLYWVASCGENSTPRARGVINTSTVAPRHQIPATTQTDHTAYMATCIYHTDATHNYAGTWPPNQPDLSTATRANLVPTTLFLRST